MLVSRCLTCGRGSNRSWPGWRSPLATSAWSGAAFGRTTRRRRAAFLLIYPDTYEIGLPNQGLQILYEILNERADAVAERAYAPWTDMEASMRAAGLPLFSVDTHRAAGDFDVLAFNLSAELVYTNLLNLVDLAGVPVRNEDRAPADPIVIAGGHCTYNPEPLAEYVDAFVIGDGEEVDRRDRRRRRRVEARRARVARSGAARPRDDPRRVRAVALRRRVRRPVHPPRSRRASPTCPRSSTSAPSPTSPTGRIRSTSSCRSSRSCTTGSTSRSSAAARAAAASARPGMITRPVRERPEEQVRTMVREGLARTGYDEVALTSLSSADFSGIDGVVADLVNDQDGHRAA